MIQHVTKKCVELGWAGDKKFQCERQRKACMSVQRAFIAWFAERQQAFVIPIRLGKRTERGLRLRVQGAPAALDFVLLPDGVQVFVHLHEQDLDCIFAGDHAPKSIGGGYVCQLEQVPRCVYPSKREFWRVHCFEPFLDWFNKEYASARYLVCYQLTGAVTWASLSLEEQLSSVLIDPTRVAIFPLHEAAT